MLSLEAKFGQLMTEASPEAVKTYRRKVQSGASIEARINLLESAVEDFPSSGRTTIRRNNGASGLVDESSAARAESDRMIQEAIASRDQDYAKAIKITEQVAGEKATLTESQLKEYDFCKLLGMSEADCLKVAKLS